MRDPLALAEAASTSGPPGEAADASQGRIFPCEACGADQVFHIGQQKLVCPFCGHPKEIELDPQAQVQEQDLSATLERLAEQRREGQEASVETREIHCEACGAGVVFTGSVTSTECAYCGSPVQRDAVHIDPDRIPVDGVLPFQVDKKTAHQALRKWMRSRWFVPKAFKKRTEKGEFDGVYLPYWTFDAMTFTRFSGERGEVYTVGRGKNRRRRVRWQPAAGSFQRFFDDILVVASTALPSQMLRALEPWPLNRCRPFAPEFLAGFGARTYETRLGEGFTQGRARADRALAADCRSRIGGDQQRLHKVDTRYDALTYKHLLLPVWLLTYRLSGKTYQVVINAVTGRVFGQRPWSTWKILFAALGVAFVFFLFRACGG